MVSGNSREVLARRPGSAFLPVILGLFSLAGSALAQQARGPNDFFDLPAGREAEVSPQRNEVRQELLMAGKYFAGRGMEQDLTKAAYWYRKAADQGEPAAQVEMGYLYRMGYGVPKSDTEAARWFMRAAASGDPIGDVNLAALYLRGQGVPQSTTEALRLLHRAAKMGYGRAEAYLGVLAFSGVGAAPDHHAAETWFRSGAKHGSPEAEFDLASLYSVNTDHQHDYAKASKLLKQSAAQGYIPAEHALGLLLLNHPELRQAPGESKKLLTSAAESGSWRSSVALSMMARKAPELPGSREDAYRWMRIALLQSGEESKQFLDAEMAKARSALTPEQQVAEESKAQLWYGAHPSSDIYRIDDGLQRAFFPIQDIPAINNVDVTKAPDTAVVAVKPAVAVGLSSSR